MQRKLQIRGRPARAKSVMRSDLVGGLAFLAASSCAGLLFVLSEGGITGAGSAPLLFFLPPVVLAGIVYGARGGLAAAVGSVGLIAYATELGLLDYALRGMALALAGGVVGLFADSRRRLKAEIDRQNDLSPDLIAILSFDGLITRVNSAASRLLGYSGEGLVGQPFLEFVHPDDREMAAAEVARLVVSDAETYRFQVRVKSRDGAVRWLEVNACSDVATRTLAAVARDVTERLQLESEREQTARRLELALNEARETNVRLHLVAEAVADGLVTVDEANTIVRFNTAAERIFAYQRAEVIGKKANVLLGIPGQESYVARFVRTGDKTIIGTPHETLGRRKDGSVFPMELLLGAATHEGERIFIGVVRDISERKQREEAQAHQKEILELAVQERTAELKLRTAELDEARLETLRKLALAAEYRDDQTFEHAQRVGNTAARLGELLGLTTIEVELIRQAAPLHDIGKLAVSDTILLKRGKLTPEQWGMMRVHTTLGHEILAGSQSEVLTLAAEIALTHHEWWDGSGYPNRLQGEQIPLSGRIVALADVYDSLTHDRPYKNAWTIKRATTEIQHQSGTQFDPAVVEAFNQLNPHQLAGHQLPQRTPKYTAQASDESPTRRPAAA